MPRLLTRHQYDLNAELEAGREARTHTPEDPDRDAAYTQQQHRDEVDINVMMARMGVTDGAIPPGAFDPKLFGSVQDFTDAPDLQEVFARTIAAREMFDQLPAATRRRFGYNPAQLLDFLGDKANWPEAVKLGLLAQDSPPPTPPVKAE